ncbi:MAG TPA: hypothetical protein VIT88_09725 [Pyrinomonadaceae bacterium]
MKTILSLLVFLSFSLWASVVVMAQDNSSLREKAEKIVKSKNRHWKLVRKEERGKQINYLFGPEKADVVLAVFYGASEQEAISEMKAAFKILSVGPGKKRSEIGDEAYFWQSENSGFAGIRFRKANVYVDVSAPSLAMAEDIAKSLAQEIPNK